MKKALLTLLSILTLTVQACWIVIDGYSHAEISGVNYFQSHINNETAINDVSVSLPLTVWCKVTVNDNIAQNNLINLAILYYQVKSGSFTSKWHVAKQITNERWQINFQSQVKLFGRNVLTLQQIRKDTGKTLKKGDKIILYVYFRNNASATSGTYIIPKSNIPVINYNQGEWVVTSGVFTINNYLLMQVIYNGQTTVGR